MEQNSKLHKGTPPQSRVPMTPTLERLLRPDLFRKEPIFTRTLQPPKDGEKVHALSSQEVQAIRNLRGQVVDLHPGMGGIEPGRLTEMIDQGITLTSLDYMLTRGCNFECTWCYAGSGPGKKDFLPFNNLQRITQEAAGLGVKLFILTGGEPLLYKDPILDGSPKLGEHFFKVVSMIKNTYAGGGIDPKILTFDDVALITSEIARQFARYKVGLCTKGDTLNPELQDFKVNQVGAFKRMRQGYQCLIDAGYGKNPDIRLVVNSVLDHTTFDGMVDLHYWVMERGFDHSIVPVHYCGNAEHEDQEAGIHSPHVHALYSLLSRIDKREFDTVWTPWSAFTYNKTCNRNRSGLHIRASGDITACSESPGIEATDRYTFGNVFSSGFSLTELVRSSKLAAYRKEFAEGYGTYVCAPSLCDLSAEDLCRGGCATRSAYSRVDFNTGLIVANSNPLNYSQHREDPLCPAWTELALQQGVLREGLLKEIHTRILERSERISERDYPFEAK